MLHQSNVKKAIAALKALLLVNKVRLVAKAVKVIKNVPLKQNQLAIIVQKRSIVVQPGKNHLHGSHRIVVRKKEIINRGVYPSTFTLFGCNTKS